MTSPGNTEWGDPTRARRRSHGAWRVLIMCAALVALLPLPIGAMHLLPAYRMQGRFLTLYTPLICVLLLAYLVYVRESFTRVAFGDVVDPIPNYYPQYPERPHDRLRRRLYKVRGLLLNLVPALLLGASIFFGVQYLRRLDHSVALAMDALADRVEAPESAFVSPPSPVDSIGLGRPEASAPGSAAPAGPFRDRPPTDEAASARARQVVLRNTVNDDVPLFTQLTALYVGTFAALVLALTMMALKEYAKGELGLTERDLILGRVPDA